LLDKGLIICVKCHFQANQTIVSQWEVLMVQEVGLSVEIRRQTWQDSFSVK